MAVSRAINARLTLAARRAASAGDKLFHIVHVLNLLAVSIGSTIASSGNSKSRGLHAADRCEFNGYIGVSLGHR
jgi:hypothetical protein